MPRECNGIESYIDYLDPVVQALIRADQAQATAPTVTIPGPITVNPSDLPHNILATENHSVSKETKITDGVESYIDYLDPVVQALIRADQAQATALVAPIQQLDVREQDKIVGHDSIKRSSREFARKLGYTLLSMVGITGVLFAFSEASEYQHAAQTVIQPTQSFDSYHSTTEVDTTVTTEKPPVVTTTEPKPEIQFLPKPGEKVADITLPAALCSQKIFVGEYTEREDLDHVVGTGGAFLDQKIPDAAVATGCDARTAREHEHEAITGTDFIGRPDRIRNGKVSRINPTGDGSSIGPGNPNGNANFWLPVAGHVTSVNENNLYPYLSSLPGDPGNSVIVGHGSTFSAPFGDVGLMKPGDRGEIHRADGRNFTYEVVSTEVVPASQYSDIIKYTHPGFNATVTFSVCTGMRNGDPGTGDEFRTIVRSVVLGSDASKSINIY